MAFPTTSVLDNFNRANGSQGANWAIINGSTSFVEMNVQSNQAVDTSATKFAWNYWTPATFGPDSECYATVAVVPADAIRVGARVTHSGTSTHSGYYIWFAGSGTNAWSIIRVDSGGVPVTLASGATQALSAGDKIGVEVFGTVVNAWYYNGSTWTQLLTYDTVGDATKYSAAGNIALEFKSATIDDFAGGTRAGGTTAKTVTATQAETAKLPRTVSKVLVA